LQKDSEYSTEVTSPAKTNAIEKAKSKIPKRSNK
jgi:hypothetical protein